jgi:molybdate transport system permease protein
VIGDYVRARAPSSLGRIVVVVALGLVIALVLGFLLVPIVALVSYQPLGRLVDELGQPVTTDAIVVSLKTNAAAMLLTIGLGTPLAYVIGRTRFRGRRFVITFIELPLVMPPAVAGIGLLVAYGRLGLLGHALRVLGIDVLFTPTAVVMAITFVASPFYIRGAIGAFEAIDSTLIDVAATLGAGQLRRMLRVAVPLARTGLAASAALAFARGIGEFGATILFAGSFQGVTQTLPTAVYSLFDANLDQAVAIGVLLLVFSGTILLLAKFVFSWPSSRSISH